MELNRRRHLVLVLALLAGVWLLVVGWQIEEHRRVVASAQADLRNRSHEIANTLGAVTRALRFRDAAVFQDRLERVLNELVSNHTNTLLDSQGLLALALLNTEGEPMITVGATNLLTSEVLTDSERWMDRFASFVLPVAGGSVNPEDNTNNLTVVLPSPRNFGTNNPARDRDFPWREPRPGNPAGNPADNTNFPAPPPIPPSANATDEIAAPSPPPGEGGARPRGGGRGPQWMRRMMNDSEFKALVARRELHGLVLVMSTDNYRAIRAHDWRVRAVISFFAAVAALGLGLAWRNLGKTADLQIRLVRAREQNAHLKELNLAAAGLAHETRNPLNIIRGQAQLLARLPEATPDLKEKSRVIMGETDKVTAQLTEFINYSRPRAVRRASVAPGAIAGEVVRTLGFDIAEKKLTVEVTGEPLSISADEQLLRQVLFNLLLNAIQAAGEQGKIQVAVARAEKGEAVLEVRDDGPGVPPENREEIFKPYFTTHQKGTGLGLAVVQQIVQAHGWEIACLPNAPRGAIFRLSHLTVVAQASRL